MKRTILVITLLAILAVSCLVLTACHSCEFGEWEVAKRATCTQEGVKERFCSCGEKQTTTIASTGHTEVIDSAVDSTCTETGLTEGKRCSVCYEVLVPQQTISATGHTEVIDSAVGPTCTETGLTEGKHCLNCDKVFIAQETVDAIGHNEIEHDAQAPTCTEVGWYAYVTCSRCNYSTYSEIPAIGHTDGEWIVDIEPDCTTNGSKHQICIVCNETIKTETIGATGHSYEAIVTEPTCIEQGYTTHTCHCGDSYTDTYVKASGTHNFQESDICDGCEQNIVDVAVNSYNMSDTILDSVIGYVVPRSDGKYDVYIKGVGVMKAYGVSPFDNDAYPLANVCIANGVTNISSYAFANCDSLTSIAIPSSVKSIDNEAFYDCDDIRSVVISDGVRSIGSLAFESCNKLTSIVIPSSVTSIGKSAFFNCSNLANITIEGSPRIGEDAFTGTAYYKGDNWQNKVLYIDNCLIEAKSVTTCVVNEGTTVIADSAFFVSTNLTSITIPDSVTIIGNAAFYLCTNLTSVTFGENSQLTNIGESVFYGCSKLTSITIPKSVTSIGYHSFMSCTSLENITIPSSVTSIGYQAFVGCSSLKNVTFAAPNGWYATQTEGATSGKNLTLTNTSTNASYLTSTYTSYYWYKNN